MRQAERVTEKCPSCGGRTEQLLLAPDLNWRVDRTVFAIRECAECGFRFTANPPVDIARYYTPNHYSRAEMAAGIDRFARAETYKLDLLKRHISEGSLLEIGPSMGAFCKLAKDDGFDVSAIEVDPGCVAFLNETLKVRAVASDDPAAAMRADPQTYDAITMWHALEHVARPWEVLAACAERLRPRGALIIAVPNPESRQARYMGARWPHHDLPRHLSHMTSGWLTAAAGKEGLERIELTTRDEGSLSVNTQSIPLWLLALTGASADRGGLSRVTAALCWRVGRFAARVMAPFDAREGNGAAYTAVFRKRV
jgi:2-polyprenyl-3-methyl-5-hydroxy-6-metoxy-1,4-benzoquinol methylase